MATDVESISTISELRDFVHLTLCAKENLVEDQFQLRERDLTKLGKPCGLQFSVFGPRQVRLSAVWASDRNVLYFYDARGVRYLKVQLEQHMSCEPQPLAS
ncbi:MAG: hypothetical protein O2820_24745 [Planctomycetota bacterium]|nr:hypothetical protein [Planctomycetota bacterium]MDA1252422.1 hypothetical protein [Planctomycetota bacterium]